MRPIATDVWRGVYVCVCVSVTRMYPAKTAGPIETPFGMWAQKGHSNHVLDGGVVPPRGRRTLGGFPVH